MFYFGAELYLGVVGQNSGVCSGLVGAVGQHSVPPLPPLGVLAATGRFPCPSWAGLLERVTAVLFINAAALAGTAFNGNALESLALTGVSSRLCHLCVCSCVVGPHLVQVGPEGGCFDPAVHLRYNP